LLLVEQRSEFQPIRRKKSFHFSGADAGKSTILRTHQIASVKTKLGQDPSPHTLLTHPFGFVSDLRLFADAELEVSNSDK
jgi:hypothetical protein